LIQRVAVLKLAVLFFAGRLSDHNGSGGMKKGKSLSLRENADPTRQAYAPAASWNQFKEMIQKAFPKKGETLFLPMAARPK